MAAHLQKAAIVEPIFATKTVSTAVFMLSFAEARSGAAAARKPYCRGSKKNLRLEKPRIECEWRDRCDRYPSTARVTVINQHIAIGRGGDGYDD